MQILLVRLRLIGDVVFTTPAIRALRRHYPDARLTYLVEAQAAPVVRGNPHLDEVMVVRRSRGVARIVDDWRLGRTLARRRFDLVIDFHGGPRGSWLTWLTGARQRIGYTVAGRSWMYTQAVERTRELRPRHSVENQWDLLAALGIAPPTPVDDPLEMAEDAAARASVDARLAAAGLGPETPLVVMHVSAGNPFRRWPASSFAAVAAGLVAADRSRAVVLTSGPSESEAAEAGRACGPRAGRARRWPIGSCASASSTSSNCARSSAMPRFTSAATAVRCTSRARRETPVVGLFGPTLAVRSLPWRDPAVPALGVEPGPLACRPCDQRVCVPGDFRCLTATPPERVIDAAERALAMARTRR